MLSYKHILVATDLSKASREIVKAASTLAKSSKSSLSIIHVLEHAPITYAGEFSIPIDANLETTLTTEAQKLLNKLAQDFDIAPDHVYLKKGTVRTEVMELALKLKVDLIVVGTHGHRGIDVLLGSRANAILHQAKCDVLVIRIKE